MRKERSSRRDRQGWDRSSRRWTPHAKIDDMEEFPSFMKNHANRIARSNQATPGVEGYAFDGVDGNQMAFWTCAEDAISVQHVHDFDEYMVVVQGCCTLLIDDKRIPLRTGDE